MKNIPLFDIIFIIIIGGILFLIDYLGYSNLISKFSVIVVMVPYFIGKFIGRVELRKELNEDQSK